MRDRQHFSGHPIKELVVSAAEPMVILPALSAVEGSEQSESKDLSIFHTPSLRVTGQGLNI
ncbi:MAG: hypothetical protein AUI53_01575 [Acidobacteria bacterium 13_1_40CM_2_60_7]|nr:MAG: hypothetical protein AUI53_01575 [Acidobacteria bacterium 13_1_40CM_2_60_7]OLE85585.1 MAG: hypothetical protein AUG07_04285 [Acidobacteria bacterium 13_1_20CM_2_60_10]